MDRWRAHCLELIANIRSKGLLLASLCFCLSYGIARADIIDDIDQLEKPKKKPKTTTETEEDQAIDSPGAIEPPPPPPQAVTKPIELPKAEPPSATSPVKSTSSSNKLDKEARRNLPIHYGCQGTTTYSRDRAIVMLEKDVVFTQEDVSLQSDEAKVKLLQGPGGSVDSAEMNGRVSMNRDSKDPTERIRARGDRAVFDNAAQIVTLDGNARLWRDGHLIKGDRIVYEIVSGTVKVDKVQGVVQPEKAGK